MYNHSKKLTAQLLLCSLLLESCYNPNLGTGKKSLPAPAAPTYQQGQYQQEPHGKPTSLTLTTLAKHPIQFPDHPRQPQAVVRSQDQPLPTTSREPSPSQQVAKKQPTSPQQTPSSRILSVRNQHELPLSQRGAQAKRQASEAIATKPVSRPAQSTQTIQAIIPPPPRPTPSPSFADQAPPGTLGQTYLAKGGHQVNFIHQAGQWWACVNEHLPIGFTRRIDLPVYCEPGLCVAQVDQHDPTWHQHRIHVCFPEKSPDQRGYVYVGSMGLKGGGNTGSSGRKECIYPESQKRWDGQRWICPSGQHPREGNAASNRNTGSWFAQGSFPYSEVFTSASTGPRQSSPQPSSSHSTSTFRTAAFQYTEKAKEISRYLEHQGTITSASEAQHVVWRLDGYLQDLRGLSSQARSLDFAAYSGQFSQLDSSLVSELEQIRQKAKDTAIEMQHLENANLQINDYNQELSKLYDLFEGEGPLCIESVAQAEQLKDQLRSSIKKLNQIANYIGLFLGNVSDAKRSDFYNKHQERIDALQKLYQELDVAALHIARAQRLNAELTRYQNRSQQIQNEFGKRFAIESPEHAAALQSQLQGHIAYLNEVWSAIQSIGFATDDDSEQAQKIHQTHISSLEQLRSDIRQSEQSLARANQLKEVLQRYKEMMQVIDDEFSGEIRVEDVDQAQKMQSSLQSHRESLLTIWAAIESLTSDDPGEDLVQFHTGYLESLQRFYEELDEIAQKLAYAHRVRTEVDRYQARMEAIREAVRATPSIDRVEQAQQLKARLQEHIAYVSELWAGIEALSEDAPEEPLRQFHAANLGMLQALAAHVEASEQRLSHAARVQKEVDRYQERMQAIQADFGEGVRITNLEQGQQIQARLQGELDYLLSVWEAIEKASSGNPEAKLCQFHNANLGMVQALHDDIAKSVSAMEAQERKRSQAERYQKVLDAVNQDFGKPVSITSLEQAAKMTQSLQGHISSLEALGPLVPGHQERLDQLRQLHQSVEQQAKRLAFHAVVTQQRQHVEEAFASINQLLQDSASDPEQVLTQASSLRDQLRADQAALAAYSSLDQQAAQLDYLRANEERVTQLLNSYSQQHGAKKREDQAPADPAVPREDAEPVSDEPKRREEQYRLATEKLANLALDQGEEEEYSPEEFSEPALHEPLPPNASAAEAEVKSYLEAWQKANPEEQSVLQTEGEKLLQAIEALKKEIKGRYRDTNKTFLVSDVSEHVWADLMQQQAAHRQELATLRSLRGQLQQALESEAASSSDDEQLYSRQALKEKQAFAQGIGEALQGRIEGLVDMLRDPQATVESYVALLSAIPALPSIIENYVNEFLYELDDEARAAQLGQLLTEAILLLVPGPNLLNLDGISKKLGKAAEKVRKGITSIIKRAGLPTSGKIRFIPRPADVQMGKLLRKEGGYVDKFENIWKRPKGNIKDEIHQIHWDVQLSSRGKKQLGHLSSSGAHLNVTPSGNIHH